MADIFLSYSRVDRPTAQTIAEALEAEGFSVWWDKILRAGQTYDEVTETMLRDSHVVVVLWSQTSVKSTWVRAEATQGQRNCVLIPAMIEDAERPIMFELVQTADLIGWQGDRSDERWSNFVADLKRGLEMPKPSGPAAMDSAPAAAEVAPPPAAPDPQPEKAPVEPAPVTPPPQAAASAAAAAAAPSQKKSSNPLPLLLGGLIILGAGGWFGFQTLMGGTSADADSTDAPEVAAITCDQCPEMVNVPGGSFTMGSPDNEANRTGNEGPQREVTLASFAISKTEITQDQWQLCEDAGVCNAAQGAGTLPVAGVSWDQAVAYASWLSDVSGATYRLPSEAEWEYAARGGEMSAYWWGSSYPGPGASGSAVKDTVEFPENGLGVSGMLGNVREWVADCYVNNYRDAPSDGAAVQTGDCDRRVVRGGSFKTGAAEHRAASRARFRRGTQDRGLGFRVVRD
ncbi:MAG: SUMF1/EgtB/PvdO family nonheme iron enzyme [Pseudomonadota bacterium]